MISVTDLRPGTAFTDNGQIFRVLAYEHIKLGRGSANIKVKVKNLRSGTVNEKSFINGARVDEANLTRKKYQFLYKDNANAYFMDEASYEQVPVSLNMLRQDALYLKEGMSVLLLFVGSEPLSIELPPKMEFVIKETGPNVKGNSATNIFKDAVLENGLSVRVPLFMNEGDRILLDTRTGQYAERAKS
ncbi:elongation factor P [Candidatus Microgenomates bacterium]|nr:elongation factor P [Candidatus Microgenomates bacterium]